MTGEEYNELINKNKVVDLVRPFWNYEDFHSNIWKERNITVLICQRKTKYEIQLCLESLLNLYPEIPVFVVDGNSQDESILYLKYKSSLYPNIKLWERDGLNSHGETMDEAIKNYITTDYVLLMDSDVISLRYGFIEGMLEQFKENPNLYATGNLMLVSRENEACGIPHHHKDVLRYAHPCCSIYHVPTYKKLRPFANHGAPCVYNMIHAEHEELDIDYYPVDKYTAHLSGASWCKPKTIWGWDYNVMIRPLVTFVVNYKNINALKKQSTFDFDIILPGKTIEDEVIIHGEQQTNINNNLYDIRFNITGEYICYLNEYNIENIYPDFMLDVKKTVISFPSDIIIINNIELKKRKLWQKEEALQ